MNTKGIFSHQTDDWATPKNIYEWYIEHCGYYDPCPLKSKYDGLVGDWPKNVFVNPPYSCVNVWVDKAINELSSFHSQHIVMLLPVRTDTEWFRRLAAYGCKILFIRKRLSFGGSKAGAPFPSMLVELMHGLENSFYVVDRDVLIPILRSIKNESEN